MVELGLVLAISQETPSASMALAGVVGKVKFVVVMIGINYGEPDQRTIRILRPKRKTVLSSRFSVLSQKRSRPY